MSTLYESLFKQICYAKTSLLPQQALYAVQGKIEMAFELGGVEKNEYFVLSHECVCEGINNPKYFNK